MPETSKNIRDRFYLAMRASNILVKLMFSLFFVLAAPSSIAFAGPPDLSTMTMTFDDEFSWSTVSGWNWVTNLPFTPPINNELQAYTPDAVVPDRDHGLLRLRADHRAWNGQAYTSGVISSFAHFQQAYGYFVMRARLPHGRGLFPAFWLLPTSGAWPPEIDIMENLGNDPTSVYMTMHLPNGSQYQSTFTGSDFSQGYHTFALLWNPTTLTWFVDGITRGSYTGPGIPNAPMYLLANVAVGGTWPGAPDASTVFPQSMDIDYIRAYQFDPAPTGTASNALTLSGIWVSPIVAKAGDFVKLSSQATVGVNSLPTGGVYEIGVCAYSGAPCYAFKVFPLGSLMANSTFGYSYWFPVPTSGFPDGWYSVYTTVLTSGGSSTSQVATRFTVQNSTTSFIAPLLSLPPPISP